MGLDLLFIKFSGEIPAVGIGGIHGAMGKDAADRIGRRNGPFEKLDVDL
jgi:hypothetical protein